MAVRAFRFHEQLLFIEARQSTFVPAKLNQLNKIKVGIVNYLNTKPLIFGIQHAPVANDLLLIEDYPANVARMLVEGTIDVGLVPVAVIPHLKEHHIITDYCIGCTGPVASVAIFSEVPIEKVEKVLLITKAALGGAGQGVTGTYWKIEPSWLIQRPITGAQIKGTTAGVAYWRPGAGATEKIYLSV